MSAFTRSPRLSFTCLFVRVSIWGSWVTTAPHAPFDMLYNDGNQCASGKKRSIHVRALTKNKPPG